jgi:hypothetical protein
VIIRGLLLLVLVATPAGAVRPGVGPDAPAGGVLLQQGPLLSIRVNANDGHRPVVTVGPVLNSAQLETAARSGLPVRVRVRVELWRDRFFDQLVDSTSWSTVIVYEPLGDQFFARSLPAGGGASRFSSFTAARSAVEGVYPLPVRPHDAGRYYYTATLQVETLSLSDLVELERWLQGELGPAVAGQRSVPAAVGQGAKRLMLRLLDLPQRRVDARSDRFELPAQAPR